MNITVINGSPKGKYSITYQSARYLEKRVLGVSFSVFHIGAEIKKIEARADVSGSYLADMVTDEQGTEQTVRLLEGLEERVVIGLRREVPRPGNFYDVGGMKIFRDLIYVMKDLMREDLMKQYESIIGDLRSAKRKQALEHRGSLELDISQEGLEKLRNTP